MAENLSSARSFHTCAQDGDYAFDWKLLIPPVRSRIAVVVLWLRIIDLQNWKSLRDYLFNLLTVQVEKANPEKFKLVPWSPSRVSYKARSRTALWGLMALHKKPLSCLCTIGAPFSVFSRVLHQRKSKILSRELLFSIVCYVEQVNVTVVELIITILL